MDKYLAIITTVLVVTQIIRLIQNTIQLHKQDVLFKKQLKGLADMDLTEKDFETQRKAYRLIVEHFETTKIKPPIIHEEIRKVVNVCAKVEVDDMIAGHEPGILERKLQQELGKEVWKYATVQKNNCPLDYSVKGRAIVSVLDKEVKDNGN